MPEKITGAVSHIQRFSVSDGPGVRTTVFLKGCPLSCLWCHNPETWDGTPSLLFYAQNCVSCGACTAVCPSGAHTFEEGVHILSRNLCTLCGACAAVCPRSALELRGRTMSAEEAMEAALRDRPFYETTGGGVTLSGGEPLLQLDFTRALLRRAKEEGLHTCLDTSGWGGRAAELVPLVDLFLWDIKETDAENHDRVTGVALAPLLASLREVDALGGKIRLRCPIIPGINDREGHIRAVVELAGTLVHLQGVDLVPYHAMGTGKAAAMGRTQEEYPALTDGRRAALLEAASGASVPFAWHQ